VAIKDKMDLAIGVAVGSSMQIALLVTPLMVILGWIIPPLADMTLSFNIFETGILFITVLYSPSPCRCRADGQYRELLDSRWEE